MTAPHRRVLAGFTLLELLVVLVIIGLVSLGVSMALGDRTADRLETECLRLAAQLEAARAQSRASGVAVRWHTIDGGYAFMGLPPGQATELPDRQPWPQPGTQAWISQPPQTGTLLLGPEPLLPAQSLTVQLGPHWVRLGTDGLHPFSILARGTSGEAQP